MGCLSIKWQRTGSLGAGDPPGIYLDGYTATILKEGNYGEVWEKGIAEGKEGDARAQERHIKKRTVP
jgi:hypothetical protein